MKSTRPSILKHIHAKGSAVFAAFTLMLAVTGTAVAAGAVDCFVVSITPVPDIPQPVGYVATEILDLKFTIEMPADRLGVSHVLEALFRCPDGHLYQNMAVPFTATIQQVTARTLAGYPFPLSVQFAQPREKAGSTVAAIEFRLPVAGTAIVSHSLYGDWRIELVLDGVPVECVHGEEFRIVATRPVGGVFSDAFESGDTSAWSQVGGNQKGSGYPCNDPEVAFRR
jgi:hypothetical protein